MVDKADFFITHKEIKADYMTTKGKNATKGNGEKCDIFLWVGAIPLRGQPD
jgi:hypothetical protein